MTQYFAVYYAVVNTPAPTHVIDTEDIIRRVPSTKEDALHQSRHHTTLILCIIVLCMAVFLSQCTTEFEVSLIIDTPTPTREPDEATDTVATATIRATSQATPRPTSTHMPSPTTLGDASHHLLPPTCASIRGLSNPAKRPRCCALCARVSLRLPHAWPCASRASLPAGGGSPSTDSNWQAHSPPTAPHASADYGPDPSSPLRCDATDTPVAGGAGIPARDTAVMAATWE